MIKELDTVVLNVDLPEHGLNAGDLGTVVLEHKHRGYEVEFMTLDGETVAVVSLSSDQVRPVGRWEISSHPYGNPIIERPHMIGFERFTVPQSSGFAGGR